jgi:phosphoribosylformylglycinamidine synthase
MPETLQSPAEITPELLSEHGITPDEYERILKALGRTPTITRPSPRSSGGGMPSRT